VRLLFDQNLSPRLPRLLGDIYPGSLHVHQLAMDRAPDTEVWRYAAAEGLTIVSKDADFHQRSLVLGHPPKVIWIRLGNCSVGDTEALLRELFIVVRRFHDDPDAAFLALARNR
jgi:predicted nuclease of predicted toxin-antitoxin system